MFRSNISKIAKIKNLIVPAVLAFVFSLGAAALTIAVAISVLVALGLASMKALGSQFGSYVSLASALFTSFNALFVAVNFWHQRRDQRESRDRLTLVETRDIERRATEELKELISAFQKAIDRVEAEGAGKQYSGVPALRLIASGLNLSDVGTIHGLVHALADRPDRVAQAQLQALSDVQRVGLLLLERIDRFEIDGTRRSMVRALLTTLPRAVQDILFRSVRDTSDQGAFPPAEPLQ
jgi:hypothetical protein